MAKQKGSEEERLISRLEAAARLGVSGETLRQWRVAGILVPLRFGYRSLKYRERDVLRIIRRGLPAKGRRVSSPKTLANAVH